MKNRLSRDQVEHYSRDGYLMIHEQIFSPEKFERVRNYCAGKFAEANKGGDQPAIIDCPHWSDPRIFEFIFADEMLDLVEPLIGPDIGVFACHLLQKPAAVGKRVPWHEDSAYWKGALTPMEVASITIALEPSLPANGCLRVIPGTHVHGYSDYAEVARPDAEVFPIEIKRHQFDEAKAVDIALQPNEASIHHGKIIHGSNPNTGATRRAVLTVRYFPATVKFTPENHPHFAAAKFNIYLARGQDRAGNRYADSTKSYVGGEPVHTA
ncbi:MAG: Protein involved in biosynthesis of mitomycin antibiotics/polyketide fumonisin [Verrucomicrobia bacterium]|nr:Protein involved in biosynthesis of mitomycin antibiotics/polyketide fumonisin [Verrucomicrobiota bacterium]